MGRNLGGALPEADRPVTVPSVSVVVPCYNGGRFIDQLLACLRLQTFQDFEVIIVDDGSTDPETLAKLAELPKEIRVVRQPNGGLPAARNAGIRSARAELVLPLDCDDTLEPSFLAETVKTIRSAPSNVAFVFTHMRLAGAIEGTFNTRFDRFDQLFANRLPYCMLFRKSAWTSVGGYDESMRDGSEDWEFNIRLAAGGFDGVEVAKSLFVYTVRREGMLLSKTARLQGTMWRNIRARHEMLYRLPVLVKCWRATNGRLDSALRAVVMLVLLKILPERGYNALFYKLMQMTRGFRLNRIYLPSKS